MIDETGVAKFPDEKGVFIRLINGATYNISSRKEDISKLDLSKASLDNQLPKNLPKRFSDNLIKGAPFSGSKVRKKTNNYGSATIPIKSTESETVKSPKKSPHKEKGKLIVANPLYSPQKEAQDSPEPLRKVQIDDKPQILKKQKINKDFRNFSTSQKFNKVTNNVRKRRNSLENKSNKTSEEIFKVQEQVKSLIFSNSTLYFLFYILKKKKTKKILFSTQ